MLCSFCPNIATGMLSPEDVQSEQPPLPICDRCLEMLSLIRDIDIKDYSLDNYTIRVVE